MKTPCWGFCSTGISVSLTHYTFFRVQELKASGLGLWVQAEQGACVVVPRRYLHRGTSHINTSHINTSHINNAHHPRTTIGP